MKDGSPQYKDVPLKIVGSNVFGRYKKQSSERTYNMMISDGWLVPFPGFKNILTINSNGQGRGIFASTKQNCWYAVIDNFAYKVLPNFTYQVLGKLKTFSGDVFISENNASEILFSDSQYLYSYKSSDNTFHTSKNTSLGSPGNNEFAIDFTPGYLTFQNTRFITTRHDDSSNNQWELSDSNNGRSWSTSGSTTAPQKIAAIQTKPDKSVGVIRMPGRGNLLLVLGQTVAEPWTDVGAQLFPYQRSQSTNLDYGLINPATLDANEDYAAFIGINEKSGPAIMYTNGGGIQRISTDGIDFELSRLRYPNLCYGYMMRQYGHVLYIATWFKDNISFIYDFNEQKFFSLTDENLFAYPIKKVAYLNGVYLGISSKDGNLYNVSTDYDYYDYGRGQKNIPRVRITNSISMPDQSRFITGYSGFTIQQGQFDYDYRNTLFDLATQDYQSLTTQNDIIIGGGYNYANNVPKITLSLSKDGGVNFGSEFKINMRPRGKRANRLLWWRLGAANDLVHQFKFYGVGSFVANDGITGIRQ